MKTFKRKYRALSFVFKSRYGGKAQWHGICHISEVFFLESASSLSSSLFTRVGLLNQLRNA